MDFDIHFYFNELRKEVINKYKEEKGVDIKIKQNEGIKNNTYFELWKTLHDHSFVNIEKNVGKIMESKGLFTPRTLCNWFDPYIQSQPEKISENWSLLLAYYYFNDASNGDTKSKPDDFIKSFNVEDKEGKKKYEKWFEKFQKEVDEKYRKKLKATELGEEEEKTDPKYISLKKWYLYPAIAVTVLAIGILIYLILKPNPILSPLDDTVATVKIKAFSAKGDLRNTFFSRIPIGKITTLKVASNNEPLYEEIWKRKGEFTSLKRIVFAQSAAKWTDENYEKYVKHRVKSPENERANSAGDQEGREGELRGGARRILCDLKKSFSSVNLYIIEHPFDEDIIYLEMGESKALILKNYEFEFAAPPYDEGLYTLITDHIPNHDNDRTSHKIIDHYDRKFDGYINNIDALKCE